MKLVDICKLLSFNDINIPDFVDDSKKKILGSHQYQQQYQAHIRLGLSNNSQLILASNMGPNHQRYFDLLCSCFDGTCRPNGAMMTYRRIKNVGREDRRKSWQSSVCFWTCSPDAAIFDARKE